MNKDRLQSFTDAVIAIIMTILVLDFKVPSTVSLDGLWDMRYKFLAYLLSFLVLALYWMNHHHMLQIAQKVTGKVLWANINFLFWTSLLPFSTSWLGEHINSVYPEMFYGIIFTLGNFAYYLLLRSLMQADGKDSKIYKTFQNYYKIYITLSVGILGVILANFYPIVGIITYFIIIVLWIIPEKRIEKLFNEI
ncbi:TMEM175 family protein [Clostridium mediterraneense]|uniref:TMEM175 family protein n=1 Tax=Clostridium mediterraneense TaxID=1805472 RepID=UPI0008338E4E|nr:TMEM175 family protein [Clostridium mediterraneense]